MKTEYNELINRLKVMDEEQLLEMFKDIEDLETIEHIADVAYYFVENNQPKDNTPWSQKINAALDESARQRHAECNSVFGQSLTT